MIDLSRLPPPTVVETYSYEAILAARKQDLIDLFPADRQAELAAVLALESEPLTKFLEESSYREVLLRARVNDAARAVMLAYATGADLEHLAAYLGVERLEGETDDRLRTRTQMA
ncbi:MAG: hypothetical protein PHC73_12625, partial [Immundisolibacter sp.]|nr:hypothetical protein [Immundisolibacter sp.]